MKELMGPHVYRVTCRRTPQCFGGNLGTVIDTTCMPFLLFSRLNPPKRISIDTYEIVMSS